MIDLDLDSKPEDMIMIKNVLAVLSRHYPGHPWAVRIDGGILEVKNQGVHATYGFALGVRGLVGDYDKRIMDAGGTVLEHFGIRRGIAKGDDYALLRRDVRGDGIPNL